MRWWNDKIKPPECIRAEEGEEEEKVERAAAEIQPAKRTKTLGCLLGRVKQSMSTIPADNRAKTEITSYLQEEVIDGDDKPLEWWEKKWKPVSFNGKHSLKIPEHYRYQNSI